MIQPWIPVVSTLIGTCLGALLSHLMQYFQHRRELKTSTRQLRLEKLELLYDTLVDIRQHYIELHSQHSNLVLPADVAEEVEAIKRDRATDEQDKSPIPFPRAQMLVGMYAPELQPAFDKVLHGRDAIGELWGDIFVEASDMNPEERQNLWEEWGEKGKSLQDAIDSMRDEVAAVVLRLTT